jgi:hypothetical protein
MKYAAEIGSGAMIGTQTHRQHGHLIRICLFFQNKESKLKDIYQLNRHI